MKALALALAAAAILAANGIAHAQAPDARGLFTRADKGQCVACHQLPEGQLPATRADIGPRLEGARMRELGRVKLREIIEDPTRGNPQTTMPPYGRHRILDPAEIQALVEFLHALP